MALEKGEEQLGSSGTQLEGKASSCVCPLLGYQSQTLGSGRFPRAAGTGDPVVVGTEVLHTLLSLGSLFSLQSPLTPTPALHLVASVSQHLQLDHLSLSFPYTLEPTNGWQRHTVNVGLTGGLVRSFPPCCLPCPPPTEFQPRGGAFPPSVPGWGGPA